MNRRRLALVAALVLFVGVFARPVGPTLLVCHVTGRATEVRAMGNAPQQVDDCCEEIRQPGSRDASATTVFVKAPCCDLQPASLRHISPATPTGAHNWLSAVANAAALLPAPIALTPPLGEAVPCAPQVAAASQRAPPALRPDSPRAPPSFS